MNGWWVFCVLCEIEIHCIMEGGWGTTNEHIFLDFTRLFLHNDTLILTHVDLLLINFFFCLLWLVPIYNSQI
jgi:hypothetical protein